MHSSKRDTLKNRRHGETPPGGAQELRVGVRGGARPSPGQPTNVTRDAIRQVFDYLGTE